MHKKTDNLTIAPATRRPVRRASRPLFVESTARAITKEQPRRAVEPTVRDFVYAVKSELRSPSMGHPLVVPPALAVDEVYRTKGRAIAKMREVVDSERAFEVARGRKDPHSPAWLNAVPATYDAESIQVTRADGMILRFFVDRMPLV